MEYQVNFGFHAFSVPSAVVDTLIRLAKENQLKVLLYLLRYPDKQLTASQIASYLRIPEEQAEEALEWWSQVNILEEKSEGKQLELFSSAFAAPQPPKSPPPQPVQLTVPVQEESPAQPKPHQKPEINDPFTFFSNENIHEIISSSHELNRLIRIAGEKYYQKEIYYAQARSLVWMYEYLGLPLEVIQILLQYCKDTGKIHQQKYIDSVALGWYEDEIFTAEAAEQRVSQLMEFYTYQNYICRIFELDAKPTKNQKEFIEIWQSMSFTEELLKYARDLSVEATGKVNFKYIHSILGEWHDTNITELSDAEKKHDEYIKAYSAKNKKGKKNKKNEEMSEKELKKMNDYMSVVNQFHFEEGESSV